MTTEDGRATPGTGEGEGGAGDPRKPGRRMGCHVTNGSDDVRPPQFTGKHWHPSLSRFPTNAMTAKQRPEPGGPPRKPRRRIGHHVTNALDDARTPQLHGKHHHPSLTPFPTKATHHPDT